MRHLLSALSVVGLLAPPQPPTQEPGTITGSVKLTSKVRGNPLATAAYAPRAVGDYRPPPTPEIQNVLVYLKDRDGHAHAAGLPQAREIVQRHEAFLPRVLAVTTGSTVSFPNDDNLYHNVFSLSAAATFDLGRFPKGQSRSRQFKRPGLVKVYCHIHSQMSASILVLNHSYFTVPSQEGRFQIADVPAGRHTVVGWHERVGERSVTVDVPAGSAAAVELSLPVDTP